MWAKLVFEFGSKHSGLDAGRAAGVVDLEYRVHGGDVQRESGAVEPGLDPADDGTASAVRNYGD